METKNNKPRKMGRRDFLALAGGIIGTISLGSTSASYADSNVFPETRCGDKSNADMSKKILVAYVSEYGSTGGVAEAIGKELCSKRAKVDVFLARNVKNLSSYQGVILGSAIYKGKWMSEAVDFVKANSETLRQVPVFYFMVCMTMRQPTEENRLKTLAYLDPVLKTIPQVKPVEIGVFAGAMHYNNLSWLNKKIIISKGLPEGDFRDWEAIRAWAGGPVFMKFKGI
jgi:menaquinone-dependent protoporphyrinogen oxidase